MTMRPGLSDNMWLFQWSVVDLEVLLRGKGNYCFNQENFKNGYGVYYLWRNKWGFSPKLPPWILHSCQWLKSQMWIPLYDIDGDSLMNSTN